MVSGNDQTENRTLVFSPQIADNLNVNIHVWKSNHRRTSSLIWVEVEAHSQCVPIWSRLHPQHSHVVIHVLTLLFTKIFTKTRTENMAKKGIPPSTEAKTSFQKAWHWLRRTGVHRQPSVPATSSAFITSYSVTLINSSNQFIRSSGFDPTVIRTGFIKLINHMFHVVGKKAISPCLLFQVFTMGSIRHLITKCSSVCPGCVAE